MNIGEKIKPLRKQLGLSQEQLADKLIVSRAAVAKWENGIGVPDIENLKKLSEVLAVSIDELVGNVSGGIKTVEEAFALENSDESHYDIYIGKKCTIYMKGWNDGIFDSYVLAQDAEFLYYVTFKKKETKVGALNKDYITVVKECIKKDKNEVALSDYENISREYFANKTVDVYFEDKNFFSGIFGEDTELLGVNLREITEAGVRLATGKVLPNGQVAKLEIQV